MIIWGGIEGSFTVQTGYRYDPTADSWVTMSTVGAPPQRTLHVAVWTGSMMIVYGGFDTQETSSGGRYTIDHAVDLDGDGLSSCDGDCNDADPGAFAVPGEVTGLTLGSGGALAWDSAAPGAGSGTVHDLLRGAVDELPVGSGPAEACLVSGTVATTETDSSLPTSGSGFFYLVRGRNSCGPGTYGFATSGAERIGATCP
jgi:hypothetical protein